MLKNKEEVNMTKKINTIAVRIHLTLHDIANILYSADEGTNYWNSRHSQLGLESCVIGILENPEKRIIISDTNCDEGKMPPGYYLTLGKIKKGLTILANEYPHIMADILKEQADSITADALVQCSIFGELRYA